MDINLRHPSFSSLVCNRLLVCAVITRTFRATAPDPLNSVSASFELIVRFFDKHSRKYLGYTECGVRATSWWAPENISLEFDCDEGMLGSLLNSSMGAYEAPLPKEKRHVLNSVISALVLPGASADMAHAMLWQTVVPSVAQTSVMKVAKDAIQAIWKNKLHNDAFALIGKKLTPGHKKN